MKVPISTKVEEQPWGARVQRIAWICLDEVSGAVVIPRTIIHPNGRELGTELTLRLDMKSTDPVGAGTTYLITDEQCVSEMMRLLDVWAGRVAREHQTTRQAMPGGNGTMLPRAA